MIKKILAFCLEVLTARQKIKELEKKAADPRRVIEKVLERGVDWFDHDKLPPNEKINYYRDIQRVLTNTAFENEVKHYLGDLIQEIAMSANENNRDKMLRYSINGVKALIERMEEIQDPATENPNTDDIHSTI